MKKGLVLEGGAMRGLFTSGVCDVMMENEIEFDGMVGVSAGAAFGCNYKSKQIGRALRYNKRFSGNKEYCSLWSLIKTGDLYGVDFCYRKIPEELDVFDTKTFNENPMEFYMVVTDIEKGEPYYISSVEAGDNLLNWMRASASLPFVSRIVEIDGGKFLDGGITDPIPLKFFEKAGYNKNVVVLTQSYDYEKKASKGIELMCLALRKYPKLCDAMKVRHEMYNETLSYIKEREKSGDALVIRPKEQLPIKRTENDPVLLQEVYDLGVIEAKKRLDEIKNFLK